MSLTWVQEEFEVNEEEGFVIACVQLNDVKNVTGTEIWVNLDFEDDDMAAGMCS